MELLLSILRNDMHIKEMLCVALNLFVPTKNIAFSTWLKKIIHSSKCLSDVALFKMAEMHNHLNSQGSSSVQKPVDPSV